MKTIFICLLIGCMCISNTTMCTIRISAKENVQLGTPAYHKFTFSTVPPKLYNNLSLLKYIKLMALNILAFTGKWTLSLIKLY